MHPEDTGSVDRARFDSDERQRLDLIAAAVSPDLAPVVSEMTKQGIPAASQLEFVRQITGVSVGSAYNGYTMSRLQGMSRSEARAHPATSALLAIGDYLGADATFIH